MNSVEFPCAKAEEKAIRDTIFLGMNSTKARDKAINLMNEEGKELTVDFLMQQLEREDYNAHHKNLSQLDSSTSVKFAAYDCLQNKGKNSKKNRGSGKDWGQNKSGAQGSSNSSHQSRKCPGMEDKCMRCGNMNTSWAKGVLLRMPSAKNVIKFDISTKCARARREPLIEPTLFKPPKTMMTPTLLKMESETQSTSKGKYT